MSHWPGVISYHKRVWCPFLIVGKSSPINAGCLIINLHGTNMFFVWRSESCWDDVSRSSTVSVPPGLLYLQLPTVANQGWDDFVRLGSIMVVFVTKLKLKDVIGIRYVHTSCTSCGTQLANVAVHSFTQWKSQMSQAFSPDFYPFYSCFSNSRTESIREYRFGWTATTFGVIVVFPPDCPSHESKARSEAVACRFLGLQQFLNVKSTSSFM